MDRKSKEKDVLVVRDEQTGEIGVVAGLKSDGSPNLTKANSKQSRDFLKFDKNSNALESFFMNFFRQYKNPSRFGFYRVALEGIEHVLEVIKEFLKNPEQNKDLLAPHKVDTSRYAAYAQSDDMKQDHPSSSKDPSEKQLGESEAKGYHPIDENLIDWRKFEDQYGIRRDDLEQSGDLTKMLNYGKSGLLSIRPSLGNQTYEIDARLSLSQNTDGTIAVVPHIFRKEANLNDEFCGHKFTVEDKNQLRTSGNMGRVVDLADPQSDKRIPSFISIDRLTNEIVSLPVHKARISNKIGNTRLSSEEIAKLKSGEPLVNKQIELLNGKTFKATLQVNAEQRGIEFVPREHGPRKDQRQSAPHTGTRDKAFYFKWTDQDGNIRAPQTLGGVELTPDQRTLFQEGKAILVRDMQRDGQGQPYTAYVKYDHEAGKPRYYRANPEQSRAKQLTPSSESRIQVPVNTDGKANEATRHVSEPLSKAQTYPKNETQQQIPHKKPTSKQRSL